MPTADLMEPEVSHDSGHRKRCVRYDLPGHAHELTFSCYRRRPFLTSVGACTLLANAMANARRNHRFRLLAYVFMPEHVHLLLWPREADYSVSAILKSVKQSVSHRVVSQLRDHNPHGLRLVATGKPTKPYRFWQAGGGYDRNITEMSTLERAANYIHMNPVRRGLVESPSEWHWSSARDWGAEGHGPLVVDLDAFGW